jgi:aarF domain-containing kinase
MTASRVPSSRFGRLFHYGGLAAGMAWGAASESVRRVAGGAGGAATSVMFNENNVERLVKKLSRMRGAALKLGQMMSFQGMI